MVVVRNVVEVGYWVLVFIVKLMMIVSCFIKVGLWCVCLMLVIMMSLWVCFIIFW